jgi:hypothetical protein
MRKLAAKIEIELKARDICALYDSELVRVWPTTICPEKRKKQIKRFAERYDLNVTFYDVGLCAVFERTQRGLRGREVILPLPSSKSQKSSRKRRS